MSKIKGVIFGIDNVLAKDGGCDEDIDSELGRLIGFLKSKGLEVIVLANHAWTCTGSESKRDLQDELDEQWGRLNWFITLRDDLPRKPQKKAVDYVLDKMGFKANEVIYVGNTETDMQTAVNGEVLFLNALWHAENTEYGIKVGNPKDVARFVDIFCLREHMWAYAIVDDDMEFYALAPYSTYMSEFASYSEDALQAAKWGGGHPDFWTQYLWSTIYFSGLHSCIDYVSPYPGHDVASGPKAIEDPMIPFTNCFRIKYLPDLIVRHRTAVKSATHRSVVNHYNQLTTIKLNLLPHYGLPEQQYKNCPIKKGKTVLVIDDICTKGYSLDTARVFIQKTGAKVVCLAWLKTINRGLTSIKEIEEDFNPFLPNSMRDFGTLRTVTYPYADFIVDPKAPKELTKKLKAYDSWDWP